MAPTGKHDTLALQFSGLNAPVELTGAGGLLPVIRQVMPHWSMNVRKSNPDDHPFQKIEQTGDDGYICTDVEADVSMSHGHKVDCICHLVAEIAWEQIRSNPLWLCLHCAAVEFGGRLVLFPNRHRAGKSTLTSVLAQRGHRIFTDDFLPVEIDTSGIILGRANGIAPRMRLPIPTDLSADLQSWVDENAGPRSSRYMYLNTESLARRGDVLPVGAVVSLDRQDDHCSAALEPASPTDIMDVLIKQNFARIAHSGRILQASCATVETADLYQLTYCSAEDAADLLEEQFASWKNSPSSIATPDRMQRENVDLNLLDLDKPTLDPEKPYGQSKGVTASEVEEAIYLADPLGLGIQKLNPTSAAIWRMLQQPSEIGDITGVLQAAFPDIDRERIHDDTVKAFEDLTENRLIEPHLQTAATPA